VVSLGFVGHIVCGHRYAQTPGPATGPTLSVPSEMFEKLFETNVKSFWEFVKDVKPHLNTRASFLFVSSNAAYNPVAPLGLYGVSKTSLIGLTKVRGDLHLLWRL
jgi:NAD(P)-dependent dehydrogenase (short-subunit alcohol dehydrogenase family)